MKSKISCWRLVKSMSGLPGGPRCAERTCVREGSGGPGRNQPRAILASVRGSRRGPTCAGGGIGRRARLRALWAEWPVEVRVLFGALERPRKSRGFLVPGRHRRRAREGRENTRENIRRALCVRRRPDRTLDALGGAAQEALLEVPVDLLGGGDRGVPELALDVDQRQSGRQPGRGRGVAQVVQAQAAAQCGVLERVLVQVA